MIPLGVINVQIYLYFNTNQHFGKIIYMKTLLNLRLNPLYAYKSIIYPNVNLFVLREK